MTGKFFAKQSLPSTPNSFAEAFKELTSFFHLLNIPQCLTWKSHAIILWEVSFSCSKKNRHFDRLYREKLCTSFLLYIKLMYPALKYTFELYTCAWKLCGCMFFFSDYRIYTWRGLNTLSCILVYISYNYRCLFLKMIITSPLTSKLHDTYLFFQFFFHKLKKNTKFQLVSPCFTSNIHATALRSFNHPANILSTFKFRAR